MALLEDLDSTIDQHAVVLHQKVQAIRDAQAGNPPPPPPPPGGALVDVAGNTFALVAGHLVVNGNAESWQGVQLKRVSDGHVALKDGSGHWYGWPLPGQAYKDYGTTEPV